MVTVKANTEWMRRIAAMRKVRIDAGQRYEKCILDVRIRLQGEMIERERPGDYVLFMRSVSLAAREQARID